MPAFAGGVAVGEVPREDEIIVTAQKREERQIDVPLIITAVAEHACAELALMALISSQTMFAAVAFRSRA
jgi:hypothetical protein